MNKPPRIIIDGNSEIKEKMKVTYNSGLVKELNLHGMNIRDLLSDIYNNKTLNIDDELIFPYYVVTFEIS